MLPHVQPLDCGFLPNSKQKNAAGPRRCGTKVNSVFSLSSTDGDRISGLLAEIEDSNNGAGKKKPFREHFAQASHRPPSTRMPLPAPFPARGEGVEQSEGDNE